MPLKVKCPNPKCRHHKVAFSVDATLAFTKMGGTARWEGMSPAKKAAHIKMMNEARIKGMAKKARNKGKE